MLNTPFSPWPSFSQEEISKVSEVLLSNKVNYWTGNEGKKFEKEFADFVGSTYAVAVSNGTVALDLALLAFDLKEGDEVIVTPRTFIASVSCIINAGAIPVFADVDLISQNITAETIEKVITSKTKGIICVHLAGWPCDMDPIIDLARSTDLFVIEDCAQAHGALYKGKSVGTIGDVGCWSFCQDKIMTTGGEGGMVTTNSEEIWSKIWSFKDHGKDWDAIFKKTHPPGFRWVHESFGTNWRMTEIQAAIGRLQLKKLPAWQKVRFRYAQQIWKAASETELLVSPNLKHLGCLGNCDSETIYTHAAYKCYVFIGNKKVDREETIARINQLGVPCFSGSCGEVYLEKAFKNKNFQPKVRLPNAKLLGETSLMFLCHPTLKQEEIDKTCEVIKKLFG
tara:strand:+ start:1690 stop:2874 length:1185 start_codon:yes stop_codon:yes gene_type:complete